MSRPTTKSIRLLPHTVSGGLTGMLYAVLTLKVDVPTSPPKVFRRGFYLRSVPIHETAGSHSLASELPLSPLGLSELSKYLMQIMEYYLALQDT
ncbi:hypothetical protein M431DRAFT_323473 [Trichoderma harzianum CBS 226.95]|uniref:Uncharacterized protein n=1 Tax=Trichoderma harzianum CBS 226.95 TaxID=983964 RepID=A0A2T3ZV24_TRIHA|nr:hypothetical protein M431DRAFT_323473 [Trichoderma harzianum CBS 226.95]PTB48671.1 hypothetical protein M431DRAFT_323473 [Trichoderma harzianum CBS 226.95]